MQHSDPHSSIVPDTEHRGVMAALPPKWRDYALLARFDRPIGWWLLFWPCAWGALLAGGETRWDYIMWMLFGAIAMRGAGCVYNDIIDADLDAQVERTALRPVASGAVSKKSACIWLFVLCFIGLIALLQLPLQAQIISVLSVALVAAYPFMKRITWWPQAWLGLVFSWGVLVGWATLASAPWGVPLAIYAGTIFWVISYDTIYALQDREDDSLVGIRSSALAMGQYVRLGVGTCYGVAFGFWMLGFWMLRPDPLALVALLPAGLHLLWQIATLKLHAEEVNGSALARFRSNRQVGFLMALACWVVGNAGM